MSRRGSPEGGASDEPPVRRGRRMRKDRRADTSTGADAPVVKGIEGGSFAPLSDADMRQIDHAARYILTDIGMSEAPLVVVNCLSKRGARLGDDGRLLFTSTLIDEALSGFQRNFTLHGQRDGLEVEFTGTRVHMGSGGAAPNMVDLETGAYRPSTLKDLYDAARMVDNLDNIHFFSRSVVARDMEDDLALDVNTAYASLAGTSKHVFTSVTLPEHVQPIADMCFAIAGSREAFLEKPFLSLNINHVVPPLRFAGAACEVMQQAALAGLPFHANTFGQLGASAPVTIAGSVAQTTAETLAGMIFGWIINPDAKITFGARPMVTDLRTGATTGGGGEQAVLMAASTQMAQFYDLPNTCIAGATDAKVADAQSGYEKSLSVTLAAQAGSNAVTQACGMQASLTGCALESYVIDNDMLGGILRSLAPVVVNEETLLTDCISGVVQSDGHYLAQPETLQRMETDFLYPQIACRRSVEDWEDDGSKDVRERARDATRDVLASHFPSHINDETDAALRSQFDIRLPREVMKSGR